MAQSKPFDIQIEDGREEAGELSQEHTSPLNLYPSNDPNNPLYWSKSRKWAMHGTICFFSLIATVNTSKFSVGLLPVAAEFHKDTNTAAFLLCFNVLALGLGNFLWVVVMRKFGRRVVFLAAPPILTIMNIWSAKATSFTSLMVATVLSGLASGAAEAPVSTVVADMFFVHERGTTLMIFHVALSSGFFLGPTINAAVVQYASWRWMCGWIAIASGILSMVSFFTVFETSYANRDIGAPRSSFAPKSSYLSIISVFYKYNREDSVFSVVWNNFAMMGYPVVAWTGLTVGVFVGWNLIVQVTSSRKLVADPYDFELHEIGLFSIAGMIGALLAVFVGGKLIDMIATSMTMRNNGVRKPEYRLPALIIPGIIGPAGILIFGLCFAANTHWIGPAVGMAMQGFGLTAASNILVTYAVDSYMELAGETLVVVFMVRGVSGCLISLYAYDWISATGMRNAFGQMISIQIFFLAFGIPVFFLGDRIRAVSKRFGPYNKFETG